MRTTLALCATLVLAAAGTGFAQGTAGVEFLTLPVGARPASLGAYAAGSGVDAVWYNPAALGTIGGLAAYVSHLEVEGLYAQTHAAAGRPFPWGSTAVSLLVQRFDPIPLRTETGVPVGEATPSNIVLAASYARSFAGKLAAGLTVKAIRSDLTRGGGLEVPNAAAIAAAVDLGARLAMRVQDLPLSIAVAVADVGTGLRYGDRPDPLPTRIRLGLAVEPLHLITRDTGFMRAVILVDGVLPLRGRRRTLGPAYGAELRFAETVSVRAGFDGSEPAHDELPLRLGVGAAAGRFLADISRRMSSHPAFGDEWIVSIGYAAQALQR